jgi:hypothetical protein
MILKTEKKEVELRPTTRKIIKMTQEKGEKNLNDYFFKAVNSGDIESIANIIFNFAEDADGKRAFNQLVEVYDFMDNWLSENGKSYEDLSIELGKMINDMGFFNKKLGDKELMEMMTNPLATFDMKKVLTDSTEKVISQAVSEEFRGFKA